MEMCDGMRKSGPIGDRVCNLEAAAIGREISSGVAAKYPQTVHGAGVSMWDARPALVPVRRRFLDFV